MKFRWPWQRRRPSTTPPGARNSRPPAAGTTATEPAASDLPNEKGWHGSSIELHDGLKVVEDADVTIPGDLMPGDKPRRRTGS